MGIVSTPDMSLSNNSRHNENCQNNMNTSNDPSTSLKYGQRPSVVTKFI